MTMDIIGPQEISESDCFDIIRALTLRIANNQTKGIKHKKLNRSDIADWDITFYKSSKTKKCYMAVHMPGQSPWEEK
jgi:hypothetical protein